MVVAGEASGDQHAAAAVRELRQRAPSLRFFGMGGAKLREENVPTITVALSSPQQVNNATPHQRRLEQIGRQIQGLLLTPETFQQFEAALADFRQTQTRLQEALANPTQTAEWLRRSNHHVGGNDLLTPPRQVDYVVKKENFVAEYRVHSFLGHSIRAGTKKHREGFANPHPWIQEYFHGPRARAVQQQKDEN